MKLHRLLDNPLARQVVAEAEADAAERLGRLTAREREVLSLITDGLQNKVAAHELGISQRTIENHRLRLMEKTGVKTFAQLIRLMLLAGV